MPVICPTPLSALDVLHALPVPALWEAPEDLYPNAAFQATFGSPLAAGWTVASGSGLLWLRTPAGTRQLCCVRFGALPGGAGRLCVLTQVQELLTDPTSGLLDRRALEAEWGGRAELCSALLLDIDHFKRHNDAWGHAAGDEVLGVLGQLLSAEAGAKGGTVSAYRLGGDEFLLLSRQPLSAAVAVRLLARFTAQCAERGWTGLTFSWGLACAPPGRASWRLLTARADEQLYEAKRRR